MCVQGHTIQRLRTLPAFVAELALLVDKPGSFVTGEDAIRIRDLFDELLMLMEEANDAVQKEST